MGAWLTTQIGTGKTASEAYGRAVADAEAEYGHQQGYSGAINSKHDGFVLVALPARMTFDKFQSLLEDYQQALETVEYTDLRYYQLPNGKAKRGYAKQLRDAKRDLAKAQKTLAKIDSDPRLRGLNFRALGETYRDKWGACLAVELKGVEAKRYGAYAMKRRGEKLFIFFGYAPS